MNGVKTLLRLLGFLLLLGLVAGGFLVYRLSQPYQGFQGETFVELPRGTGTSAIADALVQAGVVRSRWEFLLARFAEVHSLALQQMAAAFGRCEAAGRFKVRRVVGLPGRMAVA